MERIILSISIVVAFLGLLDFVIYSARSVPKSAVLGLLFWILSFAGLVYVVYTFLPIIK